MILHEARHARPGGADDGGMLRSDDRFDADLEEPGAR
jgi:hypothetical protein